MLLKWLLFFLKFFVLRAQIAVENENGVKSSILYLLGFAA